MIRDSVALSIRQPWAWLIVAGVKDVENRTWRTGHRGHFFVHAAQRLDLDGYKWALATGYDLPAMEALERGGIIGFANLVAVLEPGEGGANPWRDHAQFGYVLEDAATLPFRPLRGRLGFFPAIYREVLP